jgi:hypothetical protein
MVETVHGRIAAGETTVVSTAAVLRYGKQMEKTTTLMLFLDSLFPKIEVKCEMLRLEIKHSGGKLLHHSDLRGSVSRGNITQYSL